MTTFRNLNVYIKSKELVKQIYELLKKFPREEQYAPLRPTPQSRHLRALQ